MSEANGGALWRTALRLPRPLACSWAAPRALGGRGPVLCQLEAMFASGLVLRVAGGPQLFVSTRDKGLLPLQIILRRDDLAWLRSVLMPGMWLSVDDLLTTACRNLLGPRATPPAPCAITWRCMVAMLEQHLDAQRGGLGLTWRELAHPGWRARELFHRRPATDLSTPLRWLVGRGEGSTPAGDDMLLGALLAHWALGESNSPLLRALSAFRPEWPVLTTELSIAYLEAALEGDFAGHPLSLAKAIRDGTSAERLAWRVRRVLAHGHSSGLDCLLGFLLVARQV